MKINGLINFSSQKLNNSKQKENKNFNNENLKNLNLNSNPIANLNRGMINFGAMKKSQFKDIDLLMVNQLKAPIQNFNSNEDFQNYCQNILNENYSGEHNLKKMTDSYNEQAQLQKESILKDWINYITIENSAYNPAIQLLILSSITKNLSKETNHLPPTLNKRILADTLSEISKNCQSQKNYTCNFDKLYRNKSTEKIYNSETGLDENLTGWIKIPSHYNNPENFDKNVKKLQTLSHDSWCTKTYNAEPYLKMGDFHIFVENGKPKVGARFEDEEIVEIQGEKNDSNIPLNYIDIITNHVFDYKVSFEIANNLDELLVCKTIKEAIKEDDWERVFLEFNIDSIKDRDGMLILENFILEDKFIGNGDKPKTSLETIGITQEELLTHVKEIKGDAIFSNCLKNLGNIESVGGNLTFEIDEWADEKLPKIKTLSNLKNVGGTLDLRNTNIEAKEATKLDKIGKYLITKGGSTYKTPRLILKSTPLSRPLTPYEYASRVKHKLNTKKEIEMMIKLIDKEGLDAEEAAYETTFLVKP